MNENNPSLRNNFFYVSDYRKAVCGVIPFLKSLDPDQMFWSSPECLDFGTREMLGNAARNLSQGVDYLRVVGLSLSILEAIAISTGGDIPYEVLVGPTRKSREHSPASIGAFLTAQDSRLFTSEEKEIYLLLKTGRDLRARFDRKECPLGAYLFRHFTFNQILGFSESAAGMHAGKLSPIEFLALFPYENLSEIICAVSRVSVLRVFEINNLLKLLSDKKAA